MGLVLRCAFGPLHAITESGQGFPARPLSSEEWKKNKFDAKFQLFFEGADGHMRTHVKHQHLLHELWQIPRNIRPVIS